MGSCHGDLSDHSLHMYFHCILLSEVAIKPFGIQLVPPQLFGLICFALVGEERGGQIYEFPLVIGIGPGHRDYQHQSAVHHYGHQRRTDFYILPSLAQPTPVLRPRRWVFWLDFFSFKKVGVSDFFDFVIPDGSNCCLHPKFVASIEFSVDYSWLLIGLGSYPGTNGSTGTPCERNHESGGAGGSKTQDKAAERSLSGRRQSLTNQKPPWHFFLATIGHMDSNFFFWLLQSGIPKFVRTAK